MRFPISAILEIATYNGGMSDFLDILRERGRGALDQKMGIEIIEASPERLVATMPVAGNTQPLGLLHGGANVVLAESLGSIGTQLHAGPQRRIVGVDINATHHKSATSGIVTGVATAVTLGKTLCCYNVEITNDKGERTCTARITCLILAERN
jgi:1,4-dihydroxy-2-naphthoyl-CoA hydrolase